MVNLIPQLRADKNGKLVTRNVRAEAKTTGNSSRIPKPSLSTPSVHAAENVDPMKKVFSLGPFNWRSHDKIIDAISQQYGIDESQTVELNSMAWLAARRRGLHDQQIHAFLLAGITDPDDMLEFAQKHKRELLPNIKPGVHKKREKWVDELIEGGVTKEEFSTADKNFGSYSIMTVLDSFDFNGNAADIVRLYAEYPSKPTREALNNFLYDGGVRLDELKAFGVTRVKKYGEVIKQNLKSDNPLPLRELTDLIKNEEKTHSVLTENAIARVNSRILAVQAWGVERASELREPNAFFSVGYGSRNKIREMDSDEGFAFAKHHDEVLHLSIMRGSHATTSEAQHRALSSTAKSRDYAQVKDNLFYNPNQDDTLDYFKAGLTPEETIEGLEKGLSALSFRGIKEGATPAVASGWL